MKVRTIYVNAVLKILFLSAVLLGMMSIWSCEENPNPIALDDRNSQIVSDTLYARFDTTCALKKTITTINSNRLSLGSLEGYNFRIILKFSFTELPDTFQIDNAWMRFTTLQAVGEMPTEFTATGYPPIEDWLADTSAVWEDYAANVDFTKPLGDMEVTTAGDDTVIFNFNDLGVQWVRLWAGQDSSIKVENTGMFLDFTTANFIKEFQARNSPTNEGVFLFVADSIEQDSVVVDSFLAITDAFLVEGQFQPLPDRDHATTLTPWVTLLDFNLDTLNQIYPEGFIVISANMQLPVDWENSFRHPDFGPNLQMLPLISDPEKPESIEIDSSFIGSAVLTIDFNQLNEDSTYIEVTEGVERQELGANYIQRKLNSPDVYSGYYIEHKSQDQYLTNFSFFKRNQTDSKQRPRLIIRSLRLPDERL
jgi:hypothetical protein